MRAFFLHQRLFLIFPIERKENFLFKRKKKISISNDECIVYKGIQDAHQRSNVIINKFRKKEKKMLLISLNYCLWRLAIATISINIPCVKVIISVLLRNHFLNDSLNLLNFFFAVINENNRSNCLIQINKFLSFNNRKFLSIIL